MKIRSKPNSLKMSKRLRREILILIKYAPISLDARRRYRGSIIGSFDSIDQAIKNYSKGV